MHEPLVAGKVVVLLLGLVITTKAYQGYRRHNSSAMRSLALGFALITVGTIIEGLLFELSSVDIYTAGAIQTVVSAAGMLTILYSLYGAHTRTMPDPRT